MIFSLEVLQAKHGDCLLLHFGSDDAPKIMVIDGGPDTIYQDVLKPRLRQIKEKLSPLSPLPLSMVMVSHLDDDHVNGIIKLIEEVRDDIAAGDTPQFELPNLWFNTFDDIIGNIQIPVVSNINASASAANLGALSPFFKNLDHDQTAVIASTGQGRQLRNDARTINATVNNPFNALANGQANLVRGDGANNATIDWEDNLKITVVHPDSKRLLKLQKQWDSDLKKAKAKGDNDIIFASIAASRDTSAFNLSSIVCLMKLQEKTILFTGDARDDDILAGLKLNNLLDANGKIHVNILKVPHHGSDRNASLEFFQKVTADHYVISGDGNFGNPEAATLAMLEEGTRGREKFTIHFTNHDGMFELKKKLDDFIKQSKALGRKFKVNFRKENGPPLMVHLLKKVKP